MLGVAASADLAAFDSPGFHDALTQQMGLPRIGTLVGAVVGLIQAAATALAAGVALLILNPVLIAFAGVVGPRS